LEVVVCVGRWPTFLAAEDAIHIVDPNASQWDTLFNISTLHGGGTHVEPEGERSAVTFL
jgi:hypothetical protein